MCIAIHLYQFAFALKRMKHSLSLHLVGVSIAILTDVKSANPRSSWQKSCATTAARLFTNLTIVCPFWLLLPDGARTLVFAHENRLLQSVLLKFSLQARYVTSPLCFLRSLCSSPFLFFPAPSD